LSGVIRQGDDRLVRSETVADYIAQVAPVPFAPEFTLGRTIDSWTGRGASHLRISVNGNEPIFRLHRDVLEPAGKSAIHLRELETFEVPGVDGGVAARGWIAHHDYHGAIPVSSLKGLRARAGDIQVGGSALLEDVFPEPRFGAWTIGEVHIQDRRIIPNGRRDGFEHNIHFANLLNHLAPRGREIAKRCRTQSSARQRKRTFETQAVVTEQLLVILEQQLLPSGPRAGLLNRASAHIRELEKIAGSISCEDTESLKERASAFRRRFDAVSEARNEEPLQHLPSEGRELIGRVLTLIYEHSKDHSAAKELVDHILVGLA
jgi:molecular chaperone HtpG